MEQPGLAEAPLRVLVSGLVLDQARAGVGRHAQELLPRAHQRLAADGGGLAVLVGRHGLDLELPKDIERIPCQVPGHPAARRARGESAALRSAIQRGQEQGRPFRLVHTAHLPAPRALSLPFTWLVHDLRRIELGRLHRRWLGRRLMAQAARSSAGVLTVSAATAARLQHHLGVTATVVPNGTEHLRPLARAADAPDAPLITVGHIEPRKDVGTLVRALALDPTLPSLIVIGAPKGDCGERLRALVRELGLDSRVKLAGSLPDEAVRQHYASCAAVVLPSRYEGFGLVAAEALAAAAPLACSDLAAHREVAGEQAEYFPPGDPSACAQAIQRALAAPADRGAAGQRRIQAFSWDRSAQVLVDQWTRLARATSITPPRS